MKDKFKPGDLVTMSFASELEPGVIIGKHDKVDSFRVLIGGEIYRATESMLGHVKDEQV